MAKTLVYQMYPIAWEGVHTPEHREWENPINMMCEHLTKVKALGADYVWLSPFYPSPRCDHGYDISDYRDVDSRLGTLADIDFFITSAHNLGLKVIFDLVLNHTSIEHPWFENHPEYYCWSDRDRKGWKSLFDGRSAWSFLPEKKQYYLHLFHKKQPDLNWFPDGELNQDLVYEFRQIIGYWSELFGVDGFRLDIPQVINKDFTAKTQELGDFLFGEESLDVINTVFDGYENDFIIMECMDPTHGELIDHYVNSTPVDFVLNMIIKDEIAETEYTEHTEIAKTINKLASNPALMLELESHDSPRFPSREFMTAEESIWWMFNSPAQGICLYQGQELGLVNPSKEELPDELMLELDAQTALRHAAGESLEFLRPISRANARVPIPLDEYQRQEQDHSSYLNLTKNWIKRWKNS